jgi:hypothetical protein
VPKTQWQDHFGTLNPTPSNLPDSVIPITLEIVHSIIHYDWYRGMLARMMQFVFGSSGVHVKGPLKRGNGHARARKEINSRLRN